MIIGLFGAAAQNQVCENVNAPASVDLKPAI